MAEMFYIKDFVHYFLHFIFPVFIAWGFFRPNGRKAYLLLLSTMLVDVDHLWAIPIFDPTRGSIGFHFLHTYPMIVLYFLGTVFLRGNYRIISLGLLLHMATDFQDFYAW